MAKERLIEQSIVPSTYAKILPLNESNNKVLIEGTEKQVLEAWEFPVWRLESRNKNNRVYTRKLGEKVVKENKWSYGLLNHPDDDGDVEKIWAIEKDPHIKKINNEEYLMANVYLVGQHGKGLVKDILSVPGAGIGLSSSGFGEVLNSGEVDESTYELERYFDFVLNPSYDVWGYGNSKITEEKLKEEVKLGSKIKWNDTNWIVEKFLDDNRIEARKANQDHIYHEIPIKEIQEVIFENKLNEKLDYSELIQNPESKKKLNNISNKLFNKDTDEIKGEERDKVLDSYKQVYVKEESTIKNTTGAIMNKKFSVEEKMFRKSIENQIKECEAKIDMEDKIQGYRSILEWFDDTYKESSDLKEKVEKAIQEVDKKIKEFAKKGLKTDSLEETQKKLVKEQNELTENYKSLQEKYDLSTGILDTLKDYSKKMKDLYENQKARSNGMVEAKKFKECLKTVEALSKALKEKDNKISILENSIKKLNEDLSSTKKVLDEKVKSETTFF